MATRHHILVRDFNSNQKKAVETAADACVPKKSTSRYIRDAAIEKAGGKLDDNGSAAPKAKAKKAAAERPAKKAPRTKANAPTKKSVFAIDKRLLEPQFRDPKKRRL